ncbi:MAG TPA: cupin domain-containing protein [Rhizomicrobium sp.]|jgi:quercetin dioxygenase-like cupin family protein
MSATAFVVTPETRPRALSVLGEQLTVLAPASRTEGYEIFLQQGDVGQGPPPHSHGWDESFYVISGEIEFGYGDKAMLAKPGTLVHLPAGTTHWFRFAAKGEMVSMTSREGASAFFTDVDAKVPHGAQPDIEKLGAVAAAHGLRIGA